jgi:hypothetical protein
MNQQTQLATIRQRSPLLVARIMSMLMQNGIAMAMSQTRPHSVFALNTLRSQLLQDPFFDELHNPEELSGRLRSSSILFVDVVVLMARLLRVLIRQAPMKDEEENERVNVRNECMEQPFFDRRLINSNRPFSDEDFDDEDEACFV